MELNHFYETLGRFSKRLLRKCNRPSEGNLEQWTVNEQKLSSRSRQSHLALTMTSGQVVIHCHRHKPRSRLTVDTNDYTNTKHVPSRICPHVQDVYNGFNKTRAVIWEIHKSKHTVTLPRVGYLKKPSLQAVVVYGSDISFAVTW